MTKYTAADFANARFAEHPDGRVIARCEPVSDYAWENNKFILSDEEMANAGWVPVHTKPTIVGKHVILESRVEQIAKDLDVNVWSAVAVIEVAFGADAIIPDPEPTNTDRLEALQRSWVAEHPVSGGKSLVEYFNDHGVTAPKED